MMQRTGGCLCGAIRWTLTAEPLWQGHCHCQTCRRNTASPFTSFIGLSRAAIQFEGQPARYASSPGVTRSFCATCGTPIAFESDRWPEEIHVYAASLDDPSLFSPAFHVNWDAHLPWADLRDGLPRHTGSTDTAAST